MLQAQKYIQEGYEWVVDIDLEKFFDKVNHDMLMARVSRRVKDKVRGLTKKFRGSKLTDSIRKQLMPITRGWANYFGIAEARSIFANLDGWIRR